MARVNIYVPTWLRDRLDDHPEVNSSEVFRRAMLEELDRLERSELELERVPA